MKKCTKYVTTVKPIPGATIEGMNHHVKCCMVDFSARYRVITLRYK